MRKRSYYHNISIPQHFFVCIHAQHQECNKINCIKCFGLQHKKVYDQSVCRLQDKINGRKYMSVARKIT